MLDTPLRRLGLFAFAHEILFRWPSSAISIQRSLEFLKSPEWFHPSHAESSCSESHSPSYDFPGPQPGDSTLHPRKCNNKFSQNTIQCPITQHTQRPSFLPILTPSSTLSSLLQHTPSVPALHILISHALLYLLRILLCSPFQLTHLLHRESRLE